VFACKINTDVNQPVAIEIILPDSGRVEVSDTFRPSGRALNGFGDSVAAPLFWTSFDTTLEVLDSTTGVSIGRAQGSARLQARAGELPSNPQTVSVLARLDSMAAADNTRDTLDVTPTDSTADSLSAPLKIQTFAFGGIASGRPVIYAFTTYPDSGPVVTLLPKDTVTTASDGTASVQLRLHKGTVPDSVVVTATMRKFHGDSLPGSPVTFVVEFRP
jgi:hypothetical protein